MATTDAKPGFRLPWSADRGDAATTDKVESTTTDAQVDPTHDDEVETPAMIDAPASEAGSTVDTSTESTAASDPTTQAEVPAAEAPAGTAPPTQAAAPAPTPAPARKPNKLMADLTRAMQGAAEQAREESLTRLTADAKAFIETIHATSASEATELRRLADDDVAAVREWSKQEIARIREETETRISGRKGSLDREIEEHAAAIERRIERVQSRVASFEAEMAAFFERLTAEQDPTRLAAMAETLPEPPSFDAGMDGVDSPVAAPVVEHVAEAVAEPVVEQVEAAEAVGAVEAVETVVPTETEVVAEDVAEAADGPDAGADATPWPTEPTGAWGAAPTPEAGADTGDLFSMGADETQAGDSDPRLAALGFDLAAAEAEAAAFSVADAAPDDDIPTIADDALAARLAGLVPDTDASGEGLTTRVIVVGLVSVASIAGFKRHLSRVPGVEHVGVSSGPDGEFVFAVSRGMDLDLNTAITSLPGFAAQITGESDGDLHVTARDPESEG